MRLFTLLSFLILSPTVAFAQHVHSNNVAATETGHAAFAAVSEIVQLLENDPQTDWSEVSIQALREHLVDMDRVTMLSKTTTTQSSGSLAFDVSGEGDTVASIQRMTAAHAPMLAAETGWNITANSTQNGATLQIRTANKDELQKARALGFYGVMTIGAHHQAHHMLIATGQNPH
ncbi:hypothetical protein [Cohaesibacter celericrescens]|uniref:DinB family protein n=1 Tax=Cohaesibacter celericrescens TaxID=2067669 RepID=A0A2N5XK53_9HYPH|nr:hypothetical protein [Cohaesibacter celericrescens]PLW74818.1 hypothetical protein C0081_21075 [Cohaesibacter celericrescens]